MKQELARCNAKDRPELRERQSLFATEQPIYFYFEVYNLARDADEETAYEVEAALTPWDDAGGLKKLLRCLGRKRKKASRSASPRPAPRGTTGNT